MWKVVRLVALALGAALVADSPPPALAGAHRASKAKKKTAAPAAAAKSKAAKTPARGTSSKMPRLGSEYALIQDLRTGETLFRKNPDEVVPIASITKLMTAMVVLDSGLPLDEVLSITEDDVDTLKNSRSRLRVGFCLSRGELLHVALMSSENRAAHALARVYPGGVPAFVGDMNMKSLEMGLVNTRFADPAGLNPRNVSTASELAVVLSACTGYPEIRGMTTTPRMALVDKDSGDVLLYNNSNRLIWDSGWQLEVSKTGYILESGSCLAMRASYGGRPLSVILLGGARRQSRLLDAAKLGAWLDGRSAPQTSPPPTPKKAAARPSKRGGCSLNGSPPFAPSGRKATLKEKPGRGV